MDKALACEYCINHSMSVFQVLSPSEKELLISNHSCEIYRKGEQIYQEGEQPQGLLILSEGKVKISKEGIGGRDQIVRMAKPVGFIGYRALFADDCYTSSATAIEDSTVCILHKESVFEVLRSNSQLALNIIKYMARELGFSTSRTVTLTQKHIRGRLAESLLFLREMYGTEDDGATLKVYLSREDVANLSNMTTSNAIRTLNAFADEQIIRLKGRKIKVLDLSQLERVSVLG